MVLNSQYLGDDGEAIGEAGEYFGEEGLIRGEAGEHVSNRLTPNPGLDLLGESRQGQCY